MARIRSIKPEFWGDELLCSMPAMTRLAYIALWNEADDEGRLRAHPAYLRSRLFPYEPDCDMRQILAPLVEHGRLVVYETDGQTYGHLPNFEQHQKINKPTPSRLPRPPGVLPKSSRSAPATTHDDFRSPPGVLPESSGSPPGGKGREGKGEEWNGEEREERPGADAPAPPAASEQEEPQRRRRTRKLRPLPPVVAELRAILGEHHPDAAWDELARRLDAGDLTPDDAIAIARWAVRDEFWSKPGPSTLYRLKHWPDLLGKARAGPPKPAGPPQPTIRKFRSVQEALES